MDWLYCSDLVECLSERIGDTKKSYDSEKKRSDTAIAALDLVCSHVESDKDVINAMKLYTDGYGELITAIEEFHDGRSYANVLTACTLLSTRLSNLAEIIRTYHPSPELSPDNPIFLHTRLSFMEERLSDTLLKIKSLFGVEDDGFNE